MSIEQPVKSTPEGWPRLSSAIYYDDAAAAIDWLTQAFGFAVRLKITGDGGRIEHSELTYGEALIMVAQTGAAKPGREHMPPGVSPKSAGGGNTQCLLLFVDDVDAHCAHARANGATIADEPTNHDYGADYWVDRSYAAIDPEGHIWWITQRL
jgi:uncharacterized glyoxalase superfamily protein PhnB